jgi:DNA-binding ferritin-like protein
MPSKNKTNKKTLNHRKIKGGKSHTRSQRRNIKKRNAHKTEMVRTFMEMLNVVKLYHWKTHSFPEHKNTDHLYDQLNENIDKFVEVLLGKDESRIMKWDKHMQIPQYDDKASFKSRIYDYREFLKGLSDILDPRMDSDLLNIRDEILADINQFLYLLTFH